MRAYTYIHTYIYIIICAYKHMFMYITRTHVCVPGPGAWPSRLDGRNGPGEETSPGVPPGMMGDLEG